MNSTVINDSMTLEEKLSAIDAALLAAEPAFVNNKGETVYYPVDPSTLVMCDGCQ